MVHAWVSRNLNKREQWRFIDKEHGFSLLRQIEKKVNRFSQIKNDVFPLTWCMHVFSFAYQSLRNSDIFAPILNIQICKGQSLEFYMSKMIVFKNKRSVLSRDTNRNIKSSVYCQYGWCTANTDCVYMRTKQPDFYRRFRDNEFCSLNSS